MEERRRAQPQMELRVRSATCEVRGCASKSDMQPGLGRLKPLQRRRNVRLRGLGGGDWGEPAGISPGQVQARHACPTVYNPSLCMERSCVRDARPEGSDAAARAGMSGNRVRCLARRWLSAVGNGGIVAYGARSPARSAAEGHAQNRSAKVREYESTRVREYESTRVPGIQCPGKKRRAPESPGRAFDFLARPAGQDIVSPRPGRGGASCRGASPARRPPPGRARCRAWAPRPPAIRR